LETYTLGDEGIVPSNINLNAAYSFYLLVSAKGKTTLPLPSSNLKRLVVGCPGT